VVWQKEIPQSDKNENRFDRRVCVTEAAETRRPIVFAPEPADAGIKRHRNNRRMKQGAMPTPDAFAKTTKGPGA